MSDRSGNDSQSSPYGLIRLAVEYYTGHRGEEEPSAFTLADGARREMQEIVDRWLAPGHGYFKVRADDGAVYIIRHDVTGDRWELVMYEVGAGLNYSTPPIRTAGARMHRFPHPRKRR